MSHFSFSKGIYDNEVMWAPDPIGKPTDILWMNHRRTVESTGKVRYDTPYGGAYFSTGDTASNTIGQNFIATSSGRFPSDHNTRMTVSGWKLSSVTVTAPPTYTPSLGTLTRSGNTFKFGITSNSSYTNSGSSKRVEYTEYRQTVVYRGSSSKYISSWSKISGIPSSITVRQAVGYTTDSGVSYLIFEVRYGNSKGVGSTSTLRYDYYQPYAPTISNVSFNSNTGVFSATIEPAKTEGGRQVMSTSVYFEENGKGSLSSRKSSQTITISSKYTFTRTISNIQSVSYTGGVELKIWATSNGIYLSNSASAQYVYLSYPTKPSISLQSPLPDRSALTALRTSLMNSLVSGEYNGTPQGARLQYIKSTTYEKSSDIPAGQQWTNIGNALVVTDLGTKTLTADTATLVPDAGKYTWIRVKTWRIAESLYYRYSAPIRLNSLEAPAPIVPTAGDDYAYILSATIGEDGQSIKVKVAWDPNNSDDSNNTELSWSQYELAWKSNKGPETLDFDDASWDEGSVTVGNVTYHHSASVYIYELDKDKKYYIRARRFLVPQDGDTTYGPYSTKYQVMVSDMSGNDVQVALFTDKTTITYGEQIGAYWAYETQHEATNWRVMKQLGQSQSVTDTIIGSGTGNIRYFAVPYFMGDYTHPIIGENETSISMYVVVTIGGVDFASDTVVVNQVEKPHVDLYCADTMDVRPFYVNAVANDPTARLMLTVTSKGGSGEWVDGTEFEPEGEVMWSYAVTPEWELDWTDVDYGSDVEQAEEDMQDAREAYDAAIAELQELELTVQQLTSGLSTKNMEKDELDARVALLQDSVDELTDQLENMQETDERYESTSDALERATQELSDAEDELDAVESDITELESDLSDAEDAVDAYDLSTERSAYDSAVTAYAAALANATLPEGTEILYKCRIVMPNDVWFRAKTMYAVTGSIRSNSTGLMSNESTCEFMVNWLHAAPTPSQYVSVEPYTHDDNIGATITLERPDGAYEGDVYDVYRVSEGRFTKIADGVAFDAEIDDQYAPFGNGDSMYRVACRTSDGDVAWRDVPYTLLERDVTEDRLVRIDWSTGHVVMSLDNDITEASTKDFVTHQYSDGGVSGHWNKSVLRRLTISAALIDQYDKDTIDALEELSRSPESCFVRTSDGLAFECDATVSAIERMHNTARVSVKIEVTMIDPTGAFGANLVEEQE